MTNEAVEKLEKELKRVIEGLPSPGISWSCIDENTSGICRALILRTTKTIDGPSRALQLTPWETSEGRLAKASEHQGFVEIYYRFDQEKYDSFVQCAADSSEIPDHMKNALKQQADQDDDSFRMVNFEIGSGVECEDPGGDWYQELVKQIGKRKAGFLYPPIPRDTTDLEGILSFALAAAEANLSLANPMVLAGYVPPCSSRTACELIETYTRAGIKVFVVDARKREMNSKPFLRLASLSATSDEDQQVFVHHLQVNPAHRRPTLYTIRDLLGPTFGIHSFSNLRWKGGGGKPSKDNLRVKCIHGYVLPKLEDITGNKYSCPDCGTDTLKAEYDDLTYTGFHKKLRLHAVKSSTQELVSFKTMIKEGRMNPYFREKPSLEEELKMMEKFRKKLLSERESAKQRTLEEI